MLKEIVLTIERGFVIKDSNEPVEVLGGMTTGRITKNKSDVIRAGIEDTISRVYAEQVPEGTNGYIIHGSVQLEKVSAIVELEDREVMTHFSAVKYREK